MTHSDDNNNNIENLSSSFPGRRETKRKSRRRTINFADLRDYAASPGRRGSRRQIWGQLNIANAVKSNPSCVISESVFQTVLSEINLQFTSEAGLIRLVANGRSSNNCLGQLIFRGLSSPLENVGPVEEASKQAIKENIFILCEFIVLHYLWGNELFCRC